MSTRPVARRRFRSRGSRAVPRLLLAGAHVCARRKADPIAHLRRRPDPGHGTGARADRSEASGAGGAASTSATSKLTELLVDKSALDAELVRLRAEVASGQEGERSARRQPRLQRSRDPRLLHRHAAPRGGVAARQRSAIASSRSPGCRTSTGDGFVDYVLWGDDGKPLAVVEAKRTKKDAKIGQRQAELYANCLEAQFGQRPVIFYTNGYEHWLWDDASYPPRAVQGFFKKSELELMIQRRTSRKSLAERRDQQRRSSSATTRHARSAGSARRSRTTSTARRCW